MTSTLDSTLNVCSQLETPTDFYAINSFAFTLTCTCDPKLIQLSLDYFWNYINGIKEYEFWCVWLYLFNVTIFRFYFLIEAILRYNLHIIQLTCLKCKFLWVLVYSQIYVTITTVNFGTFSSHPKETQNLELSFLILPWPPLTHFLYL